MVRTGLDTSIVARARHKSRAVEGVWTLLFSLWNAPNPGFSAICLYDPNQNQSIITCQNDRAIMSKYADPKSELRDAFV